MTPLLKKLLIGLAIAGAIALVVFVFGNKAALPATGLVSSSTGTSPLSSSSPETSQRALEAQKQTDYLVLLLQKVNNITLDVSIFESPDFIGLKDLAAPLAPDRNPGRTNPFLTIGSEARFNEPVVYLITPLTTPDPSAPLPAPAVNGSTPAQNSVQ